VWAEFSVYSAIGLGVYAAAMAYISRRQRQAVLKSIQPLGLIEPSFEQTCWYVDRALEQEYNWVATAVGFPVLFFGCLVAWPLVVLGAGVSALVAWADARRSR
jgi:hypothetical protein